ncbi:MAG: S-methyl-5-thioribose-1-phosphate isomerase [Bacteroidota bacterium]
MQKSSMNQAIPQRSIWLHPDTDQTVQIIDQRSLPHLLKIVDIQSSDEAARAIKEMWVRGAPLIGAMAGFAYWLAVCEAKRHPQAESYLAQQIALIAAARPTAVNLAWALDLQMEAAKGLDSFGEREVKALQIAKDIVALEVQISDQIGNYGLSLIQDLYQKLQRPINILTHCNAGRMATIEWGTATAPVYKAHQAGIPLHVWVDETRPRNQGARITAWELGVAGIAHTVIADNTGGHLMQHGKVDMCIVGTDRTTRTGDVANKIGTYLKALAAWDNQVPFYVALPSSTIDWSLSDGITEIPIEERGAEEVKYIQGWSEQEEKMYKVRLTPAESPALNYGFDVTPARYVSGLLTERGLCEASEQGLLSLFPKQNQP